MYSHLRNSSALAFLYVVHKRLVRASGMHSHLRETCSGDMFALVGSRCTAYVLNMYTDCTYNLLMEVVWDPVKVQTNL